MGAETIKLPVVLQAHICVFIIHMLLVLCCCCRSYLIILQLFATEKTGTVV